MEAYQLAAIIFIIIYYAFIIGLSMYLQESYQVRDGLLSCKQDLSSMGSCL